jgi:hypothetical protein
MSTESYVQVAPDSTGAKIRNLEVTTYPDDTATAVNQQVVVLADKLGRLLDNDTAWREDTLRELRSMRELLAVIAEAVSPH